MNLINVSYNVEFIGKPVSIKPFLLIKIKYYLVPLLSYSVEYSLCDVVR
jgi:hypothetical protein